MFKKKKIQSSTCIIMLKFGPFYHVSKIIVDYILIFFKIVKIVVGDYDFKLKVKIMIENYGFLKKN